MTTGLASALPGVDDTVDSEQVPLLRCNGDETSLSDCEVDDDSDYFFGPSFYLEPELTVGEATAALICANPSGLYSSFMVVVDYSLI